MELQIESYIRVGPITFGMPMVEVRGVLQVQHREFRRSAMSKTVTDAFQSLGVFVCYNVDGRCSAVEMAAPSRAILLGEDVLAKPVMEIREWFRGLDANIKVDGAGITSLGL